MVTSKCVLLTNERSDSDLTHVNTGINSHDIGNKYIRSSIIKAMSTGRLIQINQPRGQVQI